MLKRQYCSFKAYSIQHYYCEGYESTAWNLIGWLALSVGWIEETEPMQKTFDCNTQKCGMSWILYSCSNQKKLNLF